MCLGILSAALALLWAVSTRASGAIFGQALPEVPSPAYLRDFVLEGQLLALHTFVEGEDESDVVGVRLQTEGGMGRERAETPTPCSPAGPQLHPVTKVLQAAPGS